MAVLRVARPTLNGDLSLQFHTLCYLIFDDCFGIKPKEAEIGSDSGVLQLRMQIASV